MPRSKPWLSGSNISLTPNNTWTPGKNAALFIETAQGLWKAMVDEDGGWNVRGPDPDNEAHYASGEVVEGDPDVKESTSITERSQGARRAMGRVAAAKKRARAYIMAQTGGR